MASAIIHRMLHCRPTDLARLRPRGEQEVIEPPIAAEVAKRLECAQLAAAVESPARPKRQQAARTPSAAARSIRPIRNLARNPTTPNPSQYHAPVPAQLPVDRSQTEKYARPVTPFNAYSMKPATPSVVSDGQHGRNRSNRVAARHDGSSVVRPCVSVELPN